METSTQTSQKVGSLAVVGMGMTLGSHLTPISRSYIEQADVVFAALSDNLVEEWLMRMNPDVRSLQGYYAEGKSRMDTYWEWLDLIMAEVRAGRQVCTVFYGHPGIFAWTPHKAIATARAEGFAAHMEPGVSSEDCLYADLGIDPGRYGCQHFEASQFILYDRQLDNAGYVVLWQVALAGDTTLARLSSTGAAYRQVLVDRLAKDYPLDHQVIIYRGATLPIQDPRIEYLALADLPQADLSVADTVVLPPAREMRRLPEVWARVEALDKEGETVTQS
ncbi:SAM-dependent methyltransferase [Luteibacter aegosomaticola]|uniref:SAM-dependent methyltransferase n=1 Tax=Luteibacter aegosomaticola TaxID=2911538 RepID=UPI001FF77E5F|nr:SAM-dependent methyltransferase [Luteibacter aegosomaticola]UPG90883.1 SAM-dependent methyltransferase [Luteibacter aegosomaticola]